jgi:predicted DNA-binding protein
MHPIKMRRLQIYLDPNTDTHLRRLAAKTGKPKAALIRDGINLLLEKETRKMDDSLLDLAGIAGNGGYPDASKRHDQHLYVCEDQEKPEKIYIF